MSINEIPLQPAAASFAIDLSGAGYRMALHWCAPAACWMLDIADADGAPVVLGVPLVTGADLLAQYDYLGIRGALEVQSDSDTDKVPDFASLGGDGHLYFLTP